MLSAFSFNSLLFKFLSKQSKEYKEESQQIQEHHTPDSHEKVSGRSLQTATLTQDLEQDIRLFSPLSLSFAACGRNYIMYNFF